MGAVESERWEGGVREMGELRARDRGVESDRGGSGGRDMGGVETTVKND